jgi:hypothetical protein
VPTPRDVAVAAQSMTLKARVDRIEEIVEDKIAAGALCVTLHLDDCPTGTKYIDLVDLARRYTEAGWSTKVDAGSQRSYAFVIIDAHNPA